MNALAGHVVLKLFLSMKVGGKSLVSIKIHMFMDPCPAYVLVKGIELKKLDVWDGWRGLGTINTKKNAKEFNLNNQNKN